jgi:hypothetical protein
MRMDCKHRSEHTLEQYGVIVRTSNGSFQHLPLGSLELISVENAFVVLLCQLCDFIGDR